MKCRPKEKPQPTPAEKEQLSQWVDATLDEMARERAGDPGPVVLRRLSNAEYTYTIRDLDGRRIARPGARVSRWMARRAKDS